MGKNIYLGEYGEGIEGGGRGGGKKGIFFVLTVIFILVFFSSGCLAISRRHCFFAQVFFEFQFLEGK